MKSRRLWQQITEIYIQSSENETAVTKKVNVFKDNHNQRLTSRGYKMKNHTSLTSSTLALIVFMTFTSSAAHAASCPGPDDYGYSCADVSRGYVAGVNDTGNHCDDCTTHVPLPFTFTFYGSNYDEAIVSSNGNLQFISSASAFTNTVLPSTGSNEAIFPYFDDLMTNTSGHGVFVTTEGTAPNRVFIIEWRTNYYGSTAEAFFEVQLEETSDDIYVVYGPSRDHGASATAGIQQAYGATNFLQYSYNQAVLTNGKAVRYGVLDTVPPTVNCSANPDLLWAPNHQLVPVTVSLQVTDTDSAPVDVSLVAATSNQPQNGLGYGTAANDIKGFGAPDLSDMNGSSATYTETGYLRAERSGNQKDGRTYTLTYRGSDMEGNSADCVVTVKVPHDQRPPQ